MSKKQSFKVCFCFRRIFWFRGAEPPNDVKELFNKYSDNGTVMTVDHLQKFLNEFQRETNVSKEDAQNILNNQLNIFQRNKGFHLDAFFRYLFSDLNPPHIPKVIFVSYIYVYVYVAVFFGFSIAKYLNQGMKFFNCMPYSSFMTFISHHL